MFDLDLVVSRGCGDQDASGRDRDTGGTRASDIDLNSSSSEGCSLKPKLLVRIFITSIRVAPGNSSLVSLLSSAERRSASPLSIAPGALTPPQADAGKAASSGNIQANQANCCVRARRRLALSLANNPSTASGPEPPKTSAAKHARYKRSVS